MTPVLMLMYLVGAHFVCDYPLQGDFLSKAKNPSNPIPGIPWIQAMVAHVTIHAVAVALITGLWWLAVAEWIIHFITDYAKCKNLLSFNHDQFIHLFCKFIWWMIAVKVIWP